jgi:hypothetical protein
MFSHFHTRKDMDENFTVREACAWLKNADGSQFDPPNQVLQRLGKDASMCARIQHAQWTLRLTPNMPWPHERAYPRAIIQEVFRLNPVTAPLLAALTAQVQQ